VNTIIIYMFFMSNTKKWTDESIKLFMTLLTLNSTIVGLVSMGKISHFNIHLLVFMLINLFMKY
jgi:hypothetical protein